MKKSLLALAVLGAFASAASAQSSVTLSGGVDFGVRRVGTATGYDWNTGGSGSGNNRIVFSGREDLGGGMAALFYLEHRFGINNGTNNSPTNGGTAGADCDTANTGVQACANVLWRRSYIGLTGGFGTLTLGRQDMPLQTVNGVGSATGSQTVGDMHSGGVNATVRANNSILYTSPTMSGLTVWAAIAAGEGQNLGIDGQGEVGGGIGGFLAPRIGATSERPVGFAVRYAAGPLALGVGYDKNAADQKTAGVYGSYNLGVAKLFAAFEKGDNATSLTSAKNAEDVKVWTLGVNVPLGPVLLKGGYWSVDSNLAARDGTKFGLGAEYSLSKRTELYTSMGKRSGDRFSTAAKKAAFDLGVRHRF